MPTNKQFLNRLNAGKASFYLADFHVHSPASHDFKGPDAVDSSAAEILNHVSDSEGLVGLNDKAKHEAVVVDTQDPQVFYDRLIAQRDRIAGEEGIDKGSDWAFVAITDHDVCKNAVRLSRFAWEPERLKSGRLIILPGIELSVEFPVLDTGLTAAVHLLLIFSPLAQAEHIHGVIRDASGKAWEFGEGISVDNLPEFVNGIRRHQEYRVICIAAHIGSSKGVREEAKNCILSHLEAEITRAEGELQNPELQDRQVLEERLDQFQQKRSDPNAVSLDVLQLIGSCGFDALQTRGQRDEAFYRKLHRFREGHGRSVSIVSSDAHEAESVFLHRDADGGEALIPYIKLTGVSGTMRPEMLFDEIRGKALKLGETRTTHRAPDQVTSWIEGIEIIPDASNAADFWPFQEIADEDSRRFTIHLSRNLNCVIGGRGSGKSAIIEALAFVCSPSDFNEDTSRHQEEWYQRATATLRGCQIRTCWRLLDSAGNELPRKAIFTHRYFDPAHSHSAVTCQNLDEKELLPGTVAAPLAQVFRIHDIERTAQPERLRSLFDTICGDDINGLSTKINDAVSELGSQRSRMVDVGRQIAALTTEDSPLRQYARRKRDYDEVNRPEIQQQYQRIDEAANAESIAHSLDGSWEELRSSTGLDATSERIMSWFEESKAAVLQPASELDEANGDSDATAYQPLCAGLGAAIEGRESTSTDEETFANARIQAAIENVQHECDKVTSALRSATPVIETAHRAARDTLAQTGLPTGSAERQTKKAAYEEAESHLQTYIQLWGEWDELEAERRQLFNTLESLCQQRTEIRRFTAERITQSLAADLDPTILRIEADAQPIADVSGFNSWLVKNIQWKAQHKPKRLGELSQRVTPDVFRTYLLSKDAPSLDGLTIDRPSAAEGRITSKDAESIIKDTAGLLQLEPEVTQKDEPVLFDTLPSEVQAGLWSFPTKVNNQDELLADAALKLDEVLLDDLPVIRLNDRPAETEAMRPLERLSPGQRCSAILPILLLNGTSPLVIDQPEDNLDNRLIRQVIVNVLSSIKLKRQVIVATHNPNLPVLGDAEQVVVLRAVEDEQCHLEANGNLDQQDIVSNVTDIMEGGREAFQYRHTIYQEHWAGGADVM